MTITIEIHVKKNLGGTKKIGYTKIDLERRWFSKSYADKLK